MDVVEFMTCTLMRFLSFLLLHWNHSAHLIHFPMEILTTVFLTLLYSFFHICYCYLCIAQGAFVNFIFNFRLEPVINAFRVENMSAYRYLFDGYIFLKLFKAYHTLILLELVHSLIIFFFFNKS